MTNVVRSWADFITARWGEPGARPRFVSAQARKRAAARSAAAASPESR